MTQNISKWRPWQLALFVTGIGDQPSICNTIYLTIKSPKSHISGSLLRNTPTVVRTTPLLKQYRDKDGGQCLHQKSAQWVAILAENPQKFKNIHELTKLGNLKWYKYFHDNFTRFGLPQLAKYEVQNTQFWKDAPKNLTAAIHFQFPKFCENQSTN